MKTIAVIFISFIFFIGGCNSKKTQEPSKLLPNPTPCTFTNPIGKGADPWVVKHNGYYYFIESKNGGIYISKNKKLINIKENETLVWTPPPKGWNQANIWAPELHYVRGKWYIYYAAAPVAGSPFIHQRSGVLQSVTQDPQGEYIDKGMFYTGDDIQHHTNNKWAIDLTVATIHHQLYAIWSGWEKNRDTDHTPQNLYIAKMKNPWTISSNRVKISSPTERWEICNGLPINEGPEILKHKDEVFIIYSACQSWLPTYRLGQLRLKSIHSDPMDPDSWIKSGPVFKGTKQVYGVGHASFTTSPDGTEHWIVYHTKVDSTPGWDRIIQIQPFSWYPDGSPNFGKPVPAGKSITVPPGGCEKKL